MTLMEEAKRKMERAQDALRLEREERARVGWGRYLKDNALIVTAIVLLVIVGLNLAFG